MHPNLPYITKLVTGRKDLKLEITVQKGHLPWHNQSSVQWPILGVYTEAEGEVRLRHDTTFVPCSRTCIQLQFQMKDGTS